MYSWVVPYERCYYVVSKVKNFSNSDTALLCKSLHYSNNSFNSSNKCLIFCMPSASIRFGSVSHAPSPLSTRSSRSIPPFLPLATLHSGEWRKVRCLCFLSKELVCYTQWLQLCNSVVE
jgi:hypothetical protein